MTIQAQDGSGNIATKAYSVNVLGVPSSYTYDANGNLTAKTDGADSWTYSWNTLNQLTAVSRNAVTQASCSYDPLRRRVEKVAGSTATGWVYDGPDILRQKATTGVVAETTVVIHSYGIDEPMAQEDATTSTVVYLHADALGSITRHTSASAAITESILYDTWGNVQSGTPIPFGFIGREWDPATRMYYYRARWYDPIRGGFTSEDPIGMSDGINMYAYVHGKPQTYQDPSGLSSECMPTCKTFTDRKGNDWSGASGGVCCQAGTFVPCANDYWWKKAGHAGAPRCPHASVVRAPSFYIRSEILWLA